MRIRQSNIFRLKEHGNNKISFLPGRSLLRTSTRKSLLFQNLYKACSKSSTDIRIWTAFESKERHFKMKLCLQTGLTAFRMSEKFQAKGKSFIEIFSFRDIQFFWPYCNLLPFCENPVSQENIIHFTCNFLDI